MASSSGLGEARIGMPTPALPIGKTRRPVTQQARGVLHRVAEGAFTHERVAPTPGLADTVEHFWRVRWRLAGQPPQVQETLPHPNVHIVIEPGSMAAHGVHTGRWTTLLEGDSLAFGIKFRPGAFRGILQRPVSELADRHMPLTELFGDAARVLADVLAHEDMADAVEAAERFLAPRLHTPDPQALLAAHIVDSIVDDRELVAAAELADRHGLTLRALQRLFAEYVGVGPKWVIQRYRLHEAIARVQGGEPVSWAALAQDLGYFDQAHFIADFRKLVGRTPADYASRYAPRFSPKCDLAAS